MFKPIFIRLKHGSLPFLITPKSKSVLCNSAIKWWFLFLNNLKDLDPSYKMDLDLSDCFGREKTNPSHNRKKYMVMLLVMSNFATYQYQQ